MGTSRVVLATKGDSHRLREEKGSAQERRCPTTRTVEGSVGNSDKKGEWAELDQSTLPRTMRGSYVQYSVQTLARSPRAQLDEAFEGYIIQTRKNNTTNRAMVRFIGAR